MIGPAACSSTKTLVPLILSCMISYSPKGPTRSKGRRTIFTKPQSRHQMSTNQNMMGPICQRAWGSMNTGTGQSTSFPRTDTLVSQVVGLIFEPLGRNLFVLGSYLRLLWKNTSISLAQIKG